MSARSLRFVRALALLGAAVPGCRGEAPADSLGETSTRPDTAVDQGIDVETVVDSAAADVAREDADDADTSVVDATAEDVAAEVTVGTCRALSPDATVEIPCDAGGACSFPEDAAMRCTFGEDAAGLGSNLRAGS
jgi:hypothetical protein